MFLQVLAALTLFAYVRFIIVELMFHSARLSELATSDGLTLGTYQHCLAQVTCNPAMPSCFLGECKLCPGFGNLQELLYRLLDEKT